MSFDIRSVATGVAASVSQSLSSRAMSFDGEVQASVDYNTVSIPFEQGDVFRPQGNSEICWAFRSQSLSSRAMSFDSRTAQYEMELTKSQSLSSRAMSFDKYKKLKHYSYMSQSLSSRAMSFDKVLRNNSINLSYVSIPFEQGDVFRPAIVSSML